MSVGNTHRQHKLYQFPWVALSEQFWRETIPTVIVGNTHRHCICSGTTIRLRAMQCLIKILWVTIINHRIKNPDIDHPPTLIYNVRRETSELLWLPPLWIYNQDPHPMVFFRLWMVLGFMINMVLIIINNNNNTFEPGSQSPVSAMSAIRICNRSALRTINKCDSLYRTRIQFVHAFCANYRFEIFLWTTLLASQLLFPLNFGVVIDVYRV